MVQREAVNTRARMFDAHTSAHVWVCVCVYVLEGMNFFYTHTYINGAYTYIYISTNTRTDILSFSNIASCCWRLQTGLP